MSPQVLAKFKSNNCLLLVQAALTTTAAGCTDACRYSWHFRLCYAADSWPHMRLAVFHEHPAFGELTLATWWMGDSTATTRCLGDMSSAIFVREESLGIVDGRGAPAGTGATVTCCERSSHQRIAIAILWGVSPMGPDEPYCRLMMRIQLSCAAPRATDLVMKTCRPTTVTDMNFTQRRVWRS